jgi:hypothetical protein
MERSDLESAAANYSYLRGLLSIPAGIVIILAGFGNLEWGPLRQTWVFVGSTLAAGAVYWLTIRYYNENYGRVTPSTRTQVRTAIAIISAVVVAASVRTDWILDLPVSGTAASFALVMLANNAINVRLRAHHVIIFGALLVVGLLPVWGGVTSDLKINVGLMLMGVATIATGIFDHGALKRTFGSAKGLEPGNGDVGA